MSRPTLPLLLLALSACSTVDAGDIDTASISATDPTSASATAATTGLFESTGSIGQESGGGITSTAPTSSDDSSTAATTGAHTSEDTSDHGTTAAGATDSTSGEPVLPLDGPCVLGPAAPGRLAVITNDFIEPASVHVLDLATQKLSADIAAAPSDPGLAWGDGKLVVLGRFGFDSLEVLDGETYAPLAKIAVEIDGVADANPQALTFGPDGRAYLSALASATLPVYDLNKPPAEALVDSLDLGSFADRDGSPEPGVSFTCGGTLFVGIQRLVNFVPVDLSSLVAIDLASGAAIQGLPLLGPWPKQVRLDPSDPAGHTILVLTSGIERFDLVGASSSWVVTPEQFAGVGVEGFDLQAFEVAADGARAYILATDGDYPNSAVFEVALDGAAKPTAIVSDLTTRERVIERVGDDLWIGDADPAKPRLRVFDLAQDPPVEGQSVATPGAPYLFLPIP